MDADGLPLIGPGINLSKVEPISQKRTLAFINHFVVHTAHFLNRFSNVCEEKLADISNRLQRLETSLKLLEGKLASVPGLENVTGADNKAGTTSQSEPVAVTVTTAPDQPTAAGMQTPSTNQKEATPEETREEKQENRVENDPRYAKFFKMLQVGIPSIAVKQKMQMEGLNPDLLDNPGAACPAPAKTSNGSDSDYSDEDHSNSDDDASSSGFSD